MERKEFGLSFCLALKMKMEVHVEIAGFFSRLKCCCAVVIIRIISVRVIFILNSEFILFKILVFML